MEQHGASEGMRPSGSPYWPIVGQERGWTMVLTIQNAGGRLVLPVFSFEEEAQAFLRAYGAGGWQVRETVAGELVSLLHGSLREVGCIALDPSPEVGIELVSVGRETFLDSLLGRGRSWFEDEHGREKRRAPDRVTGAFAGRGSA